MKMGIKEIWDKIPQEQQTEIRLRIQKDGFGYTTAYFWCNGRRKPKPFLRARVCQHINAVTGENHTVQELWPN